MYTAAEYMLDNNEHEATVNASPYGVEFYRRIGFRDTGAEFVETGMRVTPMSWKF